MHKYSLLINLPDAKIVCAFSSRSSKNMSLFYGDTRESLNNRKNFLSGLGVEYRDLVCAKQVHANNIRYAREGDLGKGALSYETSVADTDAFITDKKNLPLAIFTADCLSVFLYDPQRHVIGLVHAGWRSTQKHIAAGALQSMRREFGSKAENIYAGFGPSIRSCCYEVGEDFKDFFSEGIIEKNGRHYLDLAGINKKQILDFGVKKENIFDPQICTSCQAGEFFSYRREGKGCGRMISVAMLK